MEHCYASLCFGQWHGPLWAKWMALAHWLSRYGCVLEKLCCSFWASAWLSSASFMCVSSEEASQQLNFVRKKYDELGASMTRDPGATSHPSLVKCQFCGSFHGGGYMVMACRLRGRAAAKCRASQGCWIQRAASLLRRSQWRQCNEVVVGERARCFALNLAQGPVIAVWAKEQNMGGFNFADRSISFQQQLTALYISVIIPNSSGPCPTWSAVKNTKTRLVSLFTCHSSSPSHGSNVSTVLLDNCSI